MGYPQYNAQDRQFLVRLNSHFFKFSPTLHFDTIDVLVSKVSESESKPLHEFSVELSVSSLPRSSLHSF